MKMTMSRARAWLKDQWRMLAPIGWALVALAVVLAVAVTVSTVTANNRQAQPSAAELAFEAKWKDVPASVDRGKAERAIMGGNGYLWAAGCRVKLYVAGTVIDVDPTWLAADQGAAIAGMRPWSCGDPVSSSEPVIDTPHKAIPRDAEDADAAARAGYPYLWQAVQGQRVYLVVEVSATGTFLIERKLVDSPKEIPPSGETVPNTPDFFGR